MAVGTVEGRGMSIEYVVAQQLIVLQTHPIHVGIPKESACQTVRSIATDMVTGHVRKTCSNIQLVSRSAQQPPCAPWFH